jgi:hypothetical protein
VFNIKKSQKLREMVSSCCLSLILLSLSIVLVDHSWFSFVPGSLSFLVPFVSPNSTHSSRRSLVWMRFHQSARIQSQISSLLPHFPTTMLRASLPSLTHPSILNLLTNSTHHKGLSLSYLPVSSYQPSILHARKTTLYLRCHSFVLHFPHPKCPAREPR